MCCSTCHAPSGFFEYEATGLGWLRAAGALRVPDVLAVGEGPGKIYIVEPTGPFEDDPNLTDKRFPGNPTKSYRTRDPLRVMGEVADWKGHAPEQVKTMKNHLAELRRIGVEAIEE